MTMTDQPLVRLPDPDRAGERWDDAHAHQPRQLHLLTASDLAILGGQLAADLVLLLAAAPERDRMRVCHRWGAAATSLPPELFAPAGSLLAQLPRSLGCTRLRLLPLLGVPGSGLGRGMGSAVAVCDGEGSLLLVARLPHRTAFSASEVGLLRDRLRAACSAPTTSGA